MTNAFFALMGGFVITDRERNPVQVFVPHSSRLSCGYSKTLLSTIAKVDDDRLHLKVQLTDTLEAFVAADSVGSKPRRNFVVADADVVADGIISILLTVIFKTVSEFESLQVVLAHNLKPVVQLLAMNMATEAVEIAFPILMEKYEDEMSDDLMKRLLRDRLQDRLQDSLRVRLPERLRVIKKTLETEIHGRSKQDWLAKTFVLVQTTWFVVQCIARSAQHLPLSEIELTACA